MQRQRCDHARRLANRSTAAVLSQWDSSMAIQVLAGSRPGIKVNVDRPPATLYEELAPLRILMFLLMLWPIQRNSRGDVEVSLVSPMAAYTLVMYACMSVLVARAGLARLDALLQDGISFNQRMFYLIFVIILCTHFLIPCVYWTGSRALARYFNSWARFQEEWREVTGRPLRLALRRPAMILAGAAVVFPVTAVLGSRLPPDQAVVFLAAAMHSFLTGALWTSLCGALATVAADMKGHFRKRTLCESSVRDFGSLWLRLQALSDQTGSTLSSSMLQYTVMSLVLCIVTAFGVLIAFTHHDITFRVIGQVILVVDSFRHLYIVHNSGNLAMDAVESSMKAELLAIRCDPGERTYWEVRMFLRAIEANPAALQLSGFTTCSRSGFVTVFNVLCINLLVLLQLAYNV